MSTKYVYETAFTEVLCVVLLYRCESWTVSQRMISQMEDTEM